jgi:hypothetical protein
VSDHTDPARAPSVRERFGDLVCGFRTYLAYLLVLETVLLVLSLFSFLYVEPDTAAFVLLQIDFILLAVTLVPTVLALVLCDRRE